MTSHTATNDASTPTLADQTHPPARVISAPSERAPLSRRMVAVMTLSDGSELFMRESPEGWTVIEYGTLQTRECRASRRSDLALLGDIAAAYGFGPLRDAAAPAAKRPSLTLVSSR
ncbi:hypothetical protein [Pseudotabrizicola sp. 4114]|uniref:hypothetical protein n=1 Tax=Pseudotabrizicola sp. 4114 TaxID=2817731 RepID=UPI0028551932|nr:hypothetical protein [Pseudorhodobacter sp. 4114]